MSEEEKKPPTPEKTNSAEEKTGPTRNPFLNFVRDFRKENKTMAPKQLFKKAGECWRRMTPAEKEPYVDAARAAVKKPRKPKLVTKTFQKKRKRNYACSRCGHMAGSVSSVSTNLAMKMNVYSLNDKTKKKPKIFPSTSTESPTRTRTNTRTATRTVTTPGTRMGTRATTRTSTVTGTGSGTESGTGTQSGFSKSGSTATDATGSYTESENYTNQTSTDASN